MSIVFLNNDMAKKISELSTAARPLSGREIVPMNQNGVTVTAALSDVRSYTLSGVPTLSGNNTFTGNNVFNEPISGPAFINTEDIIDIGNNAGNNNITTTANSILIGNDIFSVAGENILAIGHSASSSAGGGGLGTFNNIISFGNSSCFLASGISGSTTNVISIGNNSCAEISSVGGSVENIIAIGDNSGAFSANDGGGMVVDSIFLGGHSGKFTGSIGNVTDIIAIGKESAQYLGAGSNCQDVVSIGKQSMQQSSFTSKPMSDIVAIGDNAGRNCGSSTPLTNCIFIGLSSGVNQTASRNTFVGDLTNTATPSNTSLSGCIAIGHGATPSARNTIAIGSATTPLSTTAGASMPATYTQGLRIMVNGTYYTIPLLP